MKVNSLHVRHHPFKGQGPWSSGKKHTCFALFAQRKLSHKLAGDVIEVTFMLKKQLEYKAPASVLLVQARTVR